MFQHMVNDLTFAREAFRDNGFSPITEEEFQQFLKEYAFDKLKGKRLGRTFAEKFGIKDRVLSIVYEDADAIKHIRYSKYVR